MPGSVRRIYCNIGYEPIEGSESRIICKSDGTWTSVGPFCQPGSKNYNDSNNNTGTTGNIITHDSEHSHLPPWAIALVVIGTVVIIILTALLCRPYCMDCTSNL